MSKNVTLKLIGEITDGSATLLVDQIAAVPPNQTIELRIASPGGSIFAGQRIITALRERGGEVDTFNESLAASMASVVFARGTKRTVAQGSRTMIHRPWVGGIGGEASDLRKHADLLDSLEKDLVSVYAGATGLPEDRITQLMADETWFNADEAAAIGLATTVFGKMSSAIPAEYLAKFEHVPADLLEQNEPEAEAVVPNTMAGLRASVRTLNVELVARTKERDDARNALARTKFLLSALERSYGLAAAQTVVPMPAGALGESVDVLDRFDSLQGEAQTAFYRKHKEAIWAARQNK